MRGDEGLGQHLPSAVQRRVSRLIWVLASDLTSQPQELLEVARQAAIYASGHVMLLSLEGGETSRQAGRLLLSRVLANQALTPAVLNRILLLPFSDREFTQENQGQVCPLPDDSGALLADNYALTVWSLESVGWLCEFDMLSITVLCSTPSFVARQEALLRSTADALRHSTIDKALQRSLSTLGRPPYVRPFLDLGETA